MCWCYLPNLYLQKFCLNKHLLHTAVIYSHANFLFLCTTSHISTRYEPDSNTFCYLKCNQASLKIIHWANALLAKLSCWCGECNQKQKPIQTAATLLLMSSIIYQFPCQLDLKCCHLIQRVVLFLCFYYYFSGLHRHPINVS